MPESEHAGVRGFLNAVYQASNPELARTLANEFVARYEKHCPSAVRCFLDDLEACLAHLRCPEVHRKAVRTTNSIERSFVELRRRTKVIPRFFDEKSCLKLAFAELVRAGQRTRRVKTSEIELRQLTMLREQLRKERAHPSRPSAASPARSVA